jgi:hypothetical protein
LEERRAQAVQSRRAGDADPAFGALDADAITRVVDEARPEWRDPDELHDALVTFGFLDEVTDERVTLLTRAHRATVATLPAADGSVASSFNPHDVPSGLKQTDVPFNLSQQSDVAFDSWTWIPA